MKKLPSVPFYTRLAMVLLSIVIILFLLDRGRSIFIPLFFAFLISMLMYPLCRYLEKLGLGRAAASALALLTFMTGVATFIFFFTRQIISFSHDIPLMQSKIQLLFDNLSTYIATKYHIDNAQQMEYLNKSAVGILSSAAQPIGNIFINIISFVIWTIFIFIFIFFMLYHRQLLIRFVVSLFKPQSRAKAYDVVSKTRSVINSYVLGLLLEMCILAVVNTIGFVIIGVRYAFLLGVMSAVLNIIPYLGIYTAMTISVLLTFANGTLYQAVGVAIMLLVIHFIDANILLPRVVGGRVKMNPFITIIAVLLGHLMWGIPGMFLFIPLTAMIKIVCERVENLKPWSILIGTEDNG